MWVAGQQLNISRATNRRTAAPKPPARPAATTAKAAGADALPAAQPVRHERAAPTNAPLRLQPAASASKQRGSRKGAVGMQAFRIEVGHAHGVKPANIVGAIANEAGLDAKYIGRIEIFDDYSVLDLPQGMPSEVFEQLKTVAVAGQPLRISHVGKQLASGHDPAAKKIPLSMPAKGGDRRVNEKKFADKAPLKGRAGSGHRPADAAQLKPKAHRKGTKPG